MAPTTTTYDTTRYPRIAARRPATRTVEWFASSPHRVLRRRNGEATWAPAGTVHARVIGASTTACGVPAMTWRMFFGQPFRSIEPQACRACVEHVQEAKGSRRV